MQDCCWGHSKNASGVGGSSSPSARVSEKEELKIKPKPVHHYLKNAAL
jgi:hypothetical protein